ncbi:MAG TPA: DUF5668 domain-containing protein, partial [Bryobacteraceae bacterium]
MPPDDDFTKNLRDNINRDIHERVQRASERMEYKLHRRRERYHSGASGLVLGSIIVLVGLGLLLDNMGIVQFRDIWRYWPVFLIVYGVSRILSCQAVSSLVWGGAITLIGAFLLLDNLEILTFNFDY